MKLTRSELKKLIKESLFDATNISELLSYLHSIDEAVVEMLNAMSHEENSQGLPTGDENLDFQIENEMNTVSNTVSRLIDILNKREQGDGPKSSDLSWLDSDDDPNYPGRPSKRGDASHLTVIKEQ